MTEGVKKEKLIIYICLVLLTLSLIIFLLFSLFSKEKKLENKMDNLIFETLTTKKQVGRLNSIEDKDKNIYYKISYPTTGEEGVDKVITSKIEEIKEQTMLEYLSEIEEVNTYYFIDYEIYIGIDNTISLILRENIETLDLNNTTKEHIYIIDVNKGEIINKEELFNEGYKDTLTSYLDNDTLDESKLFIKGDKLVVDNIEIPISEIESVIKRENKITEYEQSDTEEPVYTIINKEYMSIGDTVLYNKDNVSSEIIGSIKKDEVVKVYKENDKGWSILLYNDGLAFIESNKLTKKVDKVIPAEPGNENIVEETFYAITNVNLRSEASVKSDLLAEIKRNEKVTKIEQTGSWTKVRYKDIEGYVSTSYLSKTMVKNRVVKDNVTPQGQIDPTKPMVALTFDDGPNPVATPMILDTLEKYNVRATFFDLGNLMLKYPDVVKREATLGEVGTHTYSHKNLNAISDKEIAKEIELSKQAFNEVLGIDPPLLRPPYGNANAKVRTLIDIPLINWNVDSLDWKYLNKDLTLHEIDKYSNLDGKIILMHSIYKPTAEAVEVLVPDLLDRGYQIVTVSELAKYRGITLETGKIYYGFSK